MELFYKSFFLIRAFLRADAHVPVAVELPDAEDRYVTKELEDRRVFKVLEVCEVLRGMSQEGLLETEAVQQVKPSASLSEEKGLEDDPVDPPESEYVSLSPEAASG